MVQSGEWERGKFDFDHHIAFLNAIEPFASLHLCRLVERIILKKLSKTDFPFRFCKIGLFFIYFWQKKWSFVVCLFCLVCFVATLSDFDAFKEKII